MNGPYYIYEMSRAVLFCRQKKKSTMIFSYPIYITANSILYVTLQTSVWGSTLYISIKLKWIMWILPVNWKVSTIKLILDRPELKISQYLKFYNVFMSFQSYWLWEPLYFLPCCIVCGTLVPWSGIKPAASAVKVRSPKGWITREFPTETHCKSG